MKKHVLFVLLMLTLSFAVIWESGDNGEQFAKDTAAAKCKEANVEAVYTCNGNVVRVVSSLPGAGSTFYKPDGRVVECPVVSPSEMGAECMQMMIPNYCPQEEQCGESDAPDVFPGQNITEPEEQSEEPTIIPEEPVVIPDEEPPAVNNTQPPQNNQEPQNEGLENVIVKTGTENPLGFLLPVVLLLGVAALIILFLLFRNSIHHDD